MTMLAQGPGSSLRFPKCLGIYVTSFCYKPVIVIAERSFSVSSRGTWCGRVSRLAAAKRSSTSSPTVCLRWCRGTLCRSSRFRFAGTIFHERPALQRKCIQVRCSKRCLSGRTQYSVSCLLAWWMSQCWCRWGSLDVEGACGQSQDLRVPVSHITQQCIEVVCGSSAFMERISERTGEHIVDWLV